MAHTPGSPTWRARLRPAAADIHPGLAGVVALEAAAHTGLAADALFGQHLSPTWTYFGGQAGVTALGVAHAVIVVTFLAGLYGPWGLARIGFLTSVTTYTVSAGLFLSAWAAQLATQSRWTFAFRDAVFNIALAGISAVAFREPLAPPCPDLASHLPAGAR
ncbi:hypothetical protein [Kineosporia sp. R_H_3]|uniref:hypothetical protein n=1 Tax=Kineosporia sp. R_H_3 TaxID=1961848 RepID=UPI00117A5120|nr:hypothetical protein [Kineosporia sp. R_H_3]